MPNKSTNFTGEKRWLWHDSKCIVSCGGAPLEIVKKYIKNQSGGRQTSEQHLFM
nr:transposase [Okeania sp. SIO2C9]